MFDVWHVGLHFPFHTGSFRR